MYDTCVKQNLIFHSYLFEILSVLKYYKYAKRVSLGHILMNIEKYINCDNYNRPSNSNLFINFDNHCYTFVLLNINLFGLKTNSDLSFGYSIYH